MIFLFSKALSRILTKIEKAPEPARHAFIFVRFYISSEIPNLAMLTTKKMIKYASLLCLLCLTLVATTCKKNSVESELVGKTWLHSYEEDEGDVTVYRPNTFDFPPSRGRTGFTLEEGGVIKQYDIAPTDGLEEHLGNWSFEGKEEIQVRFEGNGKPAQSYTIKIVSLKDNVLKVKKPAAGN